jgi:hypothetical protein
MERASNLLGVPLNSSSAVIKRAYYKKALLVHPDKNTDPDAAEKFRELKEAYSLLCEQQDDADKQEESWFDSSAMLNMLADAVSEETLVAMYKFLIEYKNFIPEHKYLFTIIESKLSRPHIVVEPTLQNLFEQKVFIYTHDNGKKYSIPLWHHTLFFEDLIVVCTPKTEDSDVWVDDSNNVHLSVNENVSTLLQKGGICFQLGARSLLLPAEEVRVVKTQTCILRGQGVPLPDLEDILNVSNVADILVHVNLTY